MWVVFDKSKCLISHPTKKTCRNMLQPCLMWLYYKIQLHLFFFSSPVLHLMLCKLCIPLDKKSARHGYGEAMRQISSEWAKSHLGIKTLDLMLLVFQIILLALQAEIHISKDPRRPFYQLQYRSERFSIKLNKIANPHGLPKSMILHFLSVAKALISLTPYATHDLSRVNSSVAISYTCNWHWMQVAGEKELLSV